MRKRLWDQWKKNAYLLKKGYPEVEASRKETPRQKPRKRGFLETHDQKSYRHSLRFKAEELAIVKAKAQIAGCTTNDYIRVSVLGSRYQPPINAELKDTLLKVYCELTRQGNSLKEIARHLNGATATVAESECMLRILGRSLLSTHRALVKVLTFGKPSP